MDLNLVLLALSGVVLLSYVFDLIGSKARIPSVILLITMGMGTHILLQAFNLTLPFVTVLLPILGTLGLVLIVLEGALELRIEKSSAPLIAQIALVAVAGIGLTGGALSAYLHYYMGMTWLNAWILATPFAVISSAVAIPAASNLVKVDKERVVYESALSDIVGVLLFYALLDMRLGQTSVLLDMVSSVVLSLLIGAVLGLIIIAVIERIQAHVRFVPMIFSLIAVYAVSKLLHLAPLISVLTVGLILNNLDKLSAVAQLKWLIPKPMHEDMAAFKQLTIEFTFVIRTFFFVLLGYSTPFEQLMSIEAWQVAGLTLLCIFVCRWIMLRVCIGPQTRPLIWFGPRGLISVLLFLSLPKDLDRGPFTDGALMLIVLGSIVIMSAGSAWDSTAKPTSTSTTRNKSTT